MQPLKVCVIGGSNSLMKDGYVPSAIHRIQMVTNRPVECVNLAVGGTFSHFGLWQMVRTKQHIDADIILLEYALNDAELMYRGMLEHWERAFEAVVRLLKRDCPNAAIVVPMLYSRGGIHISRVSSLAAGMTYICARYDVPVVDFQSEVLRRMPPDFVERQTIYRDASHYKPHVQSFMGSLVADAVVKDLGSSRATWEIPPINGRNYQDAKSLGTNITDFVDGAHETRKFKNSKFSETALSLQAGGKIKFKLRGQIVCIPVVSVPEDGILKISFGGNNVLCSIFRSAIARNGHDFLLNCVLPDQYFRKLLEAYDDPVDYEIELLKPDQISEVDPSKVEMRSTAEMPPESEQKSLNIMDILYVGDLLPA